MCLHSQNGCVWGGLGEAHHSLHLAPSPAAPPQLPPYLLHSLSLLCSCLPSSASPQPAKFLDSDFTPFTPSLINPAPPIPPLLPASPIYPCDRQCPLDQVVWASSSPYARLQALLSATDYGPLTGALQVVQLQQKPVLHTVIVGPCLQPFAGGSLPSCMHQQFAARCLACPALAVSRGQQLAKSKSNVISKKTK